MSKLHEGIVSEIIDFWKDSHCCEHYRSLVIDSPAEKYELEDGMALFMSKKTKEMIPDGFLLTSKFNNTNVQLSQPTNATSISTTTSKLQR
jgi:hypothetical protein